MSVLVFLVAMGPMAALGIYNPPVVHHGHCIAEPGTIDALYCPAPAAPPHKKVGRARQSRAGARPKSSRRPFSPVEYLAFDSLGVIQPVAFPHAFDNELSFELRRCIG